MNNIKYASKRMIKNLKRAKNDISDGAAYSISDLENAGEDLDFLHHLGEIKDAANIVYIAAVISHAEDDYYNGNSAAGNTIVGSLINIVHVLYKSYTKAEV